MTKKQKSCSRCTNSSFCQFTGKIDKLINDFCDFYTDKIAKDCYVIERDEAWYKKWNEPVEYINKFMANNCDYFNKSKE